MQKLLFEQAETLDEESSGGHGSNWEALVGDTEEFISTWLQYAIENGKLLEDVSGEFEFNRQRLLKSGEVNIAAIAFSEPEGSQVKILPLIAINVEGDENDGQISNQFWSTYPCFLDGMKFTATVQNISLYPNRVEAKLELASNMEDIFNLHVFDVMFWKNRFVYQQDRVYDFSVAALAYSLTPVDPDEEAVINRPELIAALRNLQGSEAEDDFEPIHVSMAKMHAYLPKTEYQADMAEIRGEIVDFEPEYAEFLGNTISRIDVVIGESDEDVVLPIYYTHRSLMDGCKPAVGDFIQGVVWLQTFMVLENKSG